MRDGTPFGSRVRASAPVDGLADRAAMEAHLTDGRAPSEERPPSGAERDTSERVTLIEFMWSGLTGTQPVILISREWLQ